MATGVGLRHNWPVQRALRVIGLSLFGLIVMGVGGLIFIMWIFPRAGPAPELALEPTPASIERGRYLTEHVTQCLVCHSQRDWNRYGAPIVPGTEGMGGQKWDRERGGVPGEVYANNLTPAGVGDWSDGELYRAMAVGVGRGERPLHPTMPYPHYQALCNEDRMAIISYLRTLPSVENEVPVGHLNFPMSVIVRMVPHAASPPPCPADDATAAQRGEYLVNVAACGACHTPLERGAPDLDNMFAGGRAFPMPGGVARSSNLTRDQDTGIGSWSEAQFVAAFAEHRGALPPERASDSEPHSPMPWHSFAGMSDDDLRDIFAFLDTLETRYADIETWSPDAGAQQ